MSLTPRISVPAQRAAMALAATAAGAGLAIVFLGPAAYDWIKAIHVIAIIAWMAAILYLPRYLAISSGFALRGQCGAL